MLSRPDHAGLFLGTETEPFIESRSARAQPEQFNLLQRGMVEDAPTISVPIF